MQGLPPENPEDYVPLIPHSSEGSSVGAVNNEITSEIGSMNSLESFIIHNFLEAFRLSENPLLSAAQDPQLL
jgi:hypothetical protein